MVFHAHISLGDEQWTHWWPQFRDVINCAKLNGQKINTLGISDTQVKPALETHVILEFNDGRSPEK
jgi:hypothetical protein